MNRFLAFLLLAAICVASAVATDVESYAEAELDNLSEEELALLEVEYRPARPQTLVRGPVRGPAFRGGARPQLSVTSRPGARPVASAPQASGPRRNTLFRRNPTGNQGAVAKPVGAASKPPAAVLNANKNVAKVAAAQASNIAKAENKAVAVTKKNAVLKNLAQQFKKGGAALKEALVADKSKIVELAKKLNVKPSEVGKALADPKATISKTTKLMKKADAAVSKAKTVAKKLNKKAENKLEKAEAKAEAKAAAKSAGKKFQPKEDQSVLGKDNASLKKRLAKIVNGEPDAAEIIASKNNWDWEDRVAKSLDKFAPPESSEITSRADALTNEASEVCANADAVCVPTQASYTVNLKTCAKSKEACFHAKVAAQKVKRAVKACDTVANTCGMPGEKAKGNCMVAKAKCKKYLSATEWSQQKAAKSAKTVRDMQHLDTEADKLRVDVDVKAEALLKEQVKLKSNEEQVKECNDAKAKADQCLKAADFSAECAASRTKATGCEKLLEEYAASKTKVEEQEKALNTLKSERNAAEKAAGQGF